MTSRVWVLAPPLFLGIVLLRLVLVRAPLVRKGRLWGAALILALLALLIGVLWAVFGPASVGRYISIRYIQILGVETIWAPFAFVAVVLAFPVAAWWAMRRGSNEP